MDFCRAPVDPGRCISRPAQRFPKAKIHRPPYCCNTSTVRNGCTDPASFDSGTIWPLSQRPDRRLPVPRPFHLVDVFGTRPFTGNPLPVVGDSDGLSTGEMLNIAR